MSHTFYGKFYGNDIKLYTNNWGTEMIAYVVKNCDEKMRDWLIGYFQEHYRENETYILKFLDCQTNPDGECIFCFDKPHAASLRNFIEARGPMPYEEADIVIAALIKALTNGKETAYQCLTPDTIFYDTVENRIRILPVCPAGRDYELSCAPMEIAPEAWKAADWFATHSEVPIDWTPDTSAADVFSIGVLYMELVAGSTDWPHLNKMLSHQHDFPEKIIRCCSLLPALRPYLSELLTRTPVKTATKRFASIESAIPKQIDFIDNLKQKFSSIRDIFNDDDDFDSRPKDGGDSETR